MSKIKLSEAEKFSLIKREAIYTGLSLVGLIIFWFIAGFGTMSFETKIFHLPLWAIFGTVGVWIFAIGISFILSRKIFKDIDLGGENDE